MRPASAFHGQERRLYDERTQQSRRVEPFTRTVGRLFDPLTRGSQQSNRMQEKLTLEFDGGSRGNPGPAGIGVVVRAEDGTALVTLGRYIGRCTNNVAEYRALITAMEEARKLGGTRIVIRGDSELIIKQMRGEYRVKHPDMKVLYDEAQALIRQFDEAKIEHNLRHKNELADKLANLAMDRRQDVTDAEER